MDEARADAIKRRLHELRSGMGFDLDGLEQPYLERELQGLERNPY